jgi:TolB-like protein
MSSSASSSSVRRGSALLPAAAAALALGCLHGPHPAASEALTAFVAPQPAMTARWPPPAWREGLRARPRIAILPTQNLTGARAPVGQVGEWLRRAVAAGELEVVPEAGVDEVLAKFRIRSVSGLDRDGAAALRAGLAVDAVLVSSLDVHLPGKQPAISITARLVSTEDPPRVLWMDRVAASGDDAPGLLGLGVVDRLDVLQALSVARLAASLFGGPSAQCAAEARFTSRTRFASVELRAPDRRRVAVLPFQNLSDRRDGGEVIALELVRQLAASGAYEVVEPGLVRRELLADRIVLEGGVSIVNATTVLKALGADLALSGTVHDLTGATTHAGIPSVSFSVEVLDRRTELLAWSSTSSGRGDDRVRFFGLGLVNNPLDLACRLARPVVDGLVAERRSPTRDDPQRQASTYRAAAPPVRDPVPGTPR